MYNLHTIHHHSIYPSNSTIEYTWFKSPRNGLWYGFKLQRCSISKQTCYILNLSWTTNQSAWILFAASFDFQNIHIYLSNYKWWKPSYSLERHEKLSSIKIHRFCSFFNLTLYHSTVEEQGVFWIPYIFVFCGKVSVSKIFDKKVMLRVVPLKHADIYIPSICHAMFLWNSFT